MSGVEALRTGEEWCLIGRKAVPVGTVIERFDATRKGQFLYGDKLPGNRRFVLTK